MANISGIYGKTEMYVCVDVSNLLFIHVLVVPLLHHFPLPALLLQGLLDELGHFALLARLLSPDHKPVIAHSLIRNLTA